MFPLIYGDSINWKKLFSYRSVFSQGVPVNPKDRWEITPLQEALRNQRTDVAAYLKSKGGIIPQGTSFCSRLGISSCILTDFFFPL